MTPRAAAAPARGRAEARPRLDPVALYRRSTFVGRVPRLGLLGGIVLLNAYGIHRLATGSDTAGLGSIGSGLVFGFIALAWMGYLRVIYQVRRHDPEAWRMNRRFLAGLLGAPLGIGDPEATLYDRVVLWITAVGAATLLPLAFVQH